MSLAIKVLFVCVANSAIHALRPSAQDLNRLLLIRARLRCWRLLL